MLLASAMLSLVLVLALAGTAERNAARDELDACAARIEALKAERRRGEAARRELDRLLVRAQELATALERTRAPLPLAPAGPSAEELREHADAARDHADRLAAEIAALDVRIREAQWAPHVGAATVSPAALGKREGHAPAGERLGALLSRRAALAEERVRAEHAAAAYEAEARAAESAP